MYHTQSPVLLITFNRPHVTQRVFKAIKQAAPDRLYVAADGPRDHVSGDLELTKQVRQVINQVDWDCEVKTLFRESNLGCKEAVSSAITWFFEQEEEGIILEDDCLPGNDFFRLCDALLERYRYDSRIRHISGTNFQRGKKWGNASYYFSNISHVWGWASWRRVWKDYDKDLSLFNETQAAQKLRSIIADDMVVNSWLNIFKKIKGGTLNTWDYSLSFTNFFNNGLCVIPNVNLIRNIGFGPDGTHATNVNDPNDDMAVQELGEITHPVYFMAEKQADMFTFYKDFDIARLKKDQLPRRRFKRWLKSFFKK